jgi:hypothetical protein
MEHDLKCWPEYFTPLWNGVKTFEIRKNDRNFAVGDVLRIREWNPVEKRYTGANLRREVVYITAFPDGLRDGYVCMGLR